ncbi:energy transducer TonB [Eilatimonas milleporae]|uniref:Outer membrane transport energization protein TonB n=1 Tax=Eilatimonas milleporae TaxID=911205 RepID=A0A3M0C052_9PROT|nr:energy transducer TonB [Eilatimonas milleporae]RMB02682.1 outer membrane transport energization protein TonB [Eilatimonas milleporae]
MQTRYLPALGLSAAVTFILFFLMQSLVAYNDEVLLDEDRQLRFIDVVEDIEEQPPQRREREVEKPPEVETPPPELDTPQVQVDGPNTLNLGIGPANLGSGVDLGSIDLGPSADGDYLPLVRVQPQYPRRAQERGIEGYVIVSLTVNEDGTVPTESIEIIEADPKGYFERAARAAAGKFKYKPKVVNGKAQKVTGVKYRFTFDLADN